MKRVSFSFFLISLTVGLLAAEEHPVRVSLVGDGENRVGVHFVMEPGWHIYWKNPGDSGLATEVEWSVPAGMRAGPLMWPTPRSFNSPGGILSIGYSDEVLLMTEVEADGEASGTIGAAVSWLACKDVCLLGQSELFAPTPFAPARVQPRLFESSETRLAKPYRTESSPFATRVDEAESAPRLWLSWSTQPDEVEIFVYARGKHQPQVRSATRGALTRIDLTPRGPLAPEVEILVAHPDGSTDATTTTRIKLVKTNAGDAAGTWRIQ